MGAARSDPRRGEIPGERCQTPVSLAAQGSGSSVEWSQVRRNEKISGAVSFIWFSSKETPKQ